MPEKRTRQRARAAEAEGKAPTTQAGAFVREEILHVRERKHGARSPRQAIAIGLSKARRTGVRLAPPTRAEPSEKTRRSAVRELGEAQGAKPGRPASARRKSATVRALKREGRAAASREALSSQARAASARRSPAARSAASRKASPTKGAPVRRAAAKKAARTRAATARSRRSRG